MSDKTFTRRVMLQGVLVSVIALVLPACARTDNKLIRISIDGQFFDAEQLTVLHDVAEIMIPRTDSPGAADAQVASVIDGLMQTWAGQETREGFQQVLESFDAAARTSHGASYVSLQNDERTALIEEFDRAAFSENPPRDAEQYKKLKHLVFHVYYTSEQASSDYVRIPGQYQGDLSLDEYEKLIRERAYGQRI